MDASGNQLRAAGAASLRDMLKVNTTLTELNVSDNEIGAEKGIWGDVSKVTPEGPAALAEGLAANSSVTQVDVRSNGLADADTGKLFIPIVDALGGSFTVRLDPGDVLFLRDDARWRWTHGIPSRDVDVFADGSRSVRAPRISLTLRTMADDDGHLLDVPAPIDANV